MTALNTPENPHNATHDPVNFSDVYQIDGMSAVKRRPAFGADQFSLARALPGGKRLRPKSAHKRKRRPAMRNGVE